MVPLTGLELPNLIFVILGKLKQMAVLRCYHKDILWNDGQNAIIQRMHKTNATAVFFIFFLTCQTA